MNRTFVRLFLLLFPAVILTGCDLIRRKPDPAANPRRAVARVNNVLLYEDELEGIATSGVTKNDSTARVMAYVNSWIRKQLVMQEAEKKININEAEVERKILEYRYSLIGYEYQNFYIRKNLVDSVSDQEISQYYSDHKDNFILKKNIVRATFIKVPKGAPRTNRIKAMLYSTNSKDQEALKSYCLSFSSAYHLTDSSWVEFDKLAVNSPLADIPNKVQFLRSYNYYETNDNDHLYFLKIDAYKISDNESPLEFVRSDIKNIILNKRKAELSRKLENEIYENAVRNKQFEIYP
ncbi:MAG: peptidyl-prolyl cis-trans isomerase [Cyclobacteriaceae bacterium]